MANPIFNDSVLDNLAIRDNSQTMTINGALQKTGILFAITLIVAAATWWKFPDPTLAPSLKTYLYGALIGTVLISLGLMFKKEWAPYLGPLLAVAEGVFVGLASVIYNFILPGIVLQAVGVTLVIVGIMIVSYRMGWLRVTPLFTKILTFATLGVGIFYLLGWIMNAFGNNAVFNWYNGNSLISIGLSVVVAGIAAFNLILDFDLMDKAAQARAPKWMEWYCGVGVLITVVWLYLEILRLLSKLQRD